MKRIVIISGITLGCALGVFVALNHNSTPASADTPAPVAMPAVDIEALKAKAGTGDVEAQVRLAKLYAKGESVKLNYTEAANLYRQAAAKGNEEAQACLGELYQAGQGVPKDLKEAARLYRLAADQGNVSGQYNLAFMYEQGQELKQDEAEAAKWYRLAAEGGDALAQYDIGQRYNLGVGVPMDRIEALKWLNLAAAQGQSDAAVLGSKVNAQMTHEEVSESNRRKAAFVPKSHLTNRR